MLGEELHVGEGSAGLGESGGSLDVVGATLGYALAKLDFLLIGKIAGFNDYLENMAAADFLLAAAVFSISVFLPVPFCFSPYPAAVCLHVHAGRCSGRCPAAADRSEARPAHGWRCNR